MEKQEGKEANAFVSLATAQMSDTYLGLLLLGLGEQEVGQRFKSPRPPHAFAFRGARLLVRLHRLSEGGCSSKWFNGVEIGGVRQVSTYTSPRCQG